MTSKILVIVESPGKIKKIQDYLGKNYIVKASCGHIRDLDKKTLSIEIENNFNPLYVINSDKIKIINEIKKLKKECSDIILATDGDREGEAIAHSLVCILNLHQPKRIIFNEITKGAILKAISNPIDINYNMVYAQQTRRLLDRLVGYKISPILWNYLPLVDQTDNTINELNTKKLNIQSAGRVQSVALRIIIDKENEIINQISTPYMKITAEFIDDKILKAIDNDINIDFSQKEIQQDKINAIINIDKSLDLANGDNINKCIIFNSKLNNLNNPNDISNLEEIKKFLNLVNKKTKFIIKSIYNNKHNKNPPPPFITSTLQQEASTKLHFNIIKTMKIAQKLYEHGYITYMRSDCPNISNEAINNIKKYIVEKYGEEYSDPKNFTSKNSTSQDAHECIRPTQFINDKLTDNKLSIEDNLLYELIWKRTVGSQMIAAIINNQILEIDARNNDISILKFNIYLKNLKDNSNQLSTENFKILENIQGYFYSNHETIESYGYLILYHIVSKDKKINEPKNKVDNRNFMLNSYLKCLKINISEDYTKLPLRYNEANLVKYLEKNGIGRPSTYASIISKLLERNYIENKNIDGYKKTINYYEIINTLNESKKYTYNNNTKDIIIGKENNKLIPTNMGIKINEFMLKNFNNIIDISFSANLENFLDKIAIGKANWVNILQSFYDTFNPIIEKFPIVKKKIFY